MVGCISPAGRSLTHLLYSHSWTAGRGQSSRASGWKGRCKAQAGKTTCRCLFICECEKCDRMISCSLETVNVNKHWVFSLERLCSSFTCCLFPSSRQLGDAVIGWLSQLLKNNPNPCLQKRAFASSYWRCWTTLTRTHVTTLNNRQD